MSLFTEILNPYIRTRPQVKNKYGQWVDQERLKNDESIQIYHGLRKPISSGSLIHVFESWDSKVVIESLTFVSDGRVHPFLWVNKDRTTENLAEYNLFQMVGPEIVNGVIGSRLYPNASIIETYGHDLLETVKHEVDGQTVYTTTLKRPLTLPNGCKLSFRTSSNPDIPVTYKSIIRKIYEVGY